MRSPIPAEPAQPGYRKLTGQQVVSYLLLVVAPTLAALVILDLGADLPRPVAEATAATPLVPSALAVLRLPIFLTQIIVIIAAARALGFVLRRLGQPAVVGEMLAGLLLGRSFLGFFAPAVYTWLFPVGTVRFLNALSQFGLVLFMFLVGLDVDGRETAGHRRTIAVIAHAGIAIPMLLGIALALPLYATFATSAASFTSFALFLGCALSVTAFPVLARILSERHLITTEFGRTAMACAAFADVTAWIVLAFVLEVTRVGAASRTGLAVGVLGTTVYVMFMLKVVRPWLARWWASHTPHDGGDPFEHREGVLTTLLLVVLVSALATEFLGVQALFGAFLGGVVMPRGLSLRRALRVRFEDALSILLLPLFFAYAGLRADISSIRTDRDWGIFLAIVAVAVIGKIGGSALAARTVGSSWRWASALGVLMNARGMMELVLLTIGLQAGIITPRLFTLMLLMAIVTTMMTTPLLGLVMPKAAEVKAGG